MPRYVLTDEDVVKIKKLVQNKILGNSTKIITDKIEELEKKIRTWQERLNDLKAFKDKKDMEYIKRTNCRPEPKRATYRKIAELFGVDPSTIFRIAKGERRQNKIIEIKEKDNAGE